MQLGSLIIDIAGNELTNEDIDLLKHPYIGGIILFSRNFVSVDQIKELIIYQLGLTLLLKMVKKWIKVKFW